MSGTCIISFDCEGKWGLVDNLTSYHLTHFTPLNINKAYLEILTALDEREFSSTFAFVGAFTMEEHYFLDKWSEKLKSSNAHQKWLENFPDSSWFCPELISLVRSFDSQDHEICSHGFTHLAWDTDDINALNLEIDGILDWYSLHSISSQTFIFPRNIIKNKDLLSRFGVNAYRNKISNQYSIHGFERLMQLLNEFNIFAQLRSVSLSQSLPISIPGEIFLNWRSGLRKIIPMNITTRRLGSLLDNAIQNNGVINLWSHPHNFISGDKQIDLFQDCLDVIAMKVQSGDIEVLTQEQYIKKQYATLLNNEY